MFQRQYGVQHMLDEDGDNVAPKYIQKKTELQSLYYLLRLNVFNKTYARIFIFVVILTRDHP